MNATPHNHLPHSPEQLERLKTLTATVYICQLLTFVLAGIPLLVGVVINLFNRNEVEGTWLESHFNWQIQTAWISLAGFALAGLTFEMGIGFFILLPTIVWLVFRIVLGWNTLNDNRRIREKLF